MGGKLSVVRAVLLTTTYCHGLCSERAHNKSKDIALEAVLAGGRSRLPVLTSEDRAAALGQLIASAKVRKALSGATGQVSQAESAPSQPPVDVECPAAGLGVGSWTTTIEDHHYNRHRFWATDAGFCKQTGLWTGGCGEMCPLRAAVIGTTAGLGPGMQVLDIGSACGHFARWFSEWFGASTFGVDFLEEAVAYANQEVSNIAPAKFCWLDVAKHGLSWVPSQRFDLATAVSVLHYMRTDHGRFERRDPGNATRTPCAQLANTQGTQCRVAIEMFRALRVGGRLWIAHNGCYKGKWDPRRVWGPQYWSCCFGSPIKEGRAMLLEVPEDDLFLHSPEWDKTYSVIVQRLG